MGSDPAPIFANLFLNYYVNIWFTNDWFDLLIYFLFIFGFLLMIVVNLEEAFGKFIILHLK